MEAASEAGDAGTSQGRGRGRGKSRGGLGKYLRARGRGHGRGRPAEFGKRILLEGEEAEELDEEEFKELNKKYARRQLGSNADRYAEPEPELDSDGEPIVEPEVDISAFLDKQRQISPEPPSAPPPPEEEIDTSLAHLNLGGTSSQNTRKGKIQQIDWDESLEEMSREKASAEATRDLKARFRARATKDKMKAPVNLNRTHKAEKSYVVAPALPTDAPAVPKSEKEGMEDFLDDLLG